MQLLTLGYSADAIRHRLATGRLHRLWPGVYAVGRPELTRFGWWRAATLVCGPSAALSHSSAAALYEIGYEGTRIEVSVAATVARHRSGIVVHRRARLDVQTFREVRRIPVTSPVDTLIDLAAIWPVSKVQAAINEADKRDLIGAESLRAALDDVPARPGLRPLRRMLDRNVFALTDSELERLLLPIVRRAGLGKPLTGHVLNGFKVDFYWPDLGLVVETDGLRYHRTPAQQQRDRLRDQAHTATGLTPLRFTHAQIRYEPAHVEATLTAVANRLRTSA